MASLIPPAGVFFSWHTLLYSFIASVKQSKQVGLYNLQEIMLSNSMGYFCEFNNSASDCLYDLLFFLKEKNKNATSVIVPDYTCQLVYDVINSVKLKVITCPINYNDFSLSENKLNDLIDDTTLAVIDQHLFGYHAGLEKKFLICKKRNIPYIEDSAQLLLIGKKRRIVGDFILFSFNWDKVLTCGGGGLLLAKEEKNAILYKKEFATNLSSNLLIILKDSVKLLLYRLLINPTIYRYSEKFIQAIIKGKKGSFKKFSHDISIFKIFFLIESVKEYPILRKERIRNALFWMNRYQNLTDIRIPTVIKKQILESDAIRFPLIFSEYKKLSEVKNQLKKEGISTTEMFSDLFAPDKSTLCLPTGRLNMNKSIK